MSDPRPRPTKPRFGVGQWLAYTIGLSRHVVQVVEYAGAVGHQRQHFYRLRESIPYGEPVEYELPEASLEPATNAEILRECPAERVADAYYES